MEIIFTDSVFRCCLSDERIPPRCLNLASGRICSPDSLGSGPAPELSATCADLSVKIPGQPPGISQNPGCFFRKGENPGSKIPGGFLASCRPKPPPQPTLPRASNDRIQPVLPLCHGPWVFAKKSRTMRVESSKFFSRACGAIVVNLSIS